jgi:hypothetical protein
VTKSQLSDEDATALELGRLILQGVPYGYKKGTEPTLVKLPAVDGIPPLDIKEDGPAKGFGETKGTRKSLPITGNKEPNEASIRAKPWQSIWWYFDGHPYRVTKAYKIAYQVEENKPAPGAKPTVRHILIGYMGIDPGGGG